MATKRAFSNKQKLALYAEGVNFCACCGTIKPLSEFPKLHNAVSGHGSRCKECMRKDNAARSTGGATVGSAKKSALLSGRRLRIDGRLMRTATAALSRIVEYVEVTNKPLEEEASSALSRYSDKELLEELARRGYAHKDFSRVRVELHYSPVGNE